MRPCRHTTGAIFFSVAIAMLACSVSAAPLEIKPGEPLECHSPDGKLGVFVAADAPTYSVKRRLPDGSWQELVEPSTFGLVIEGASGGEKPVKFVVKENVTTDLAWNPVFGKTSSPSEPCRELGLEFPSTDRFLMEARFRIFDDGVAIRYVLCKRPGSDEKTCTLKVTGDLTEFRFADDCITWSYNGEHNPKGPVNLSGVKSPLRMPVTLKASDSCYMALLEAALFDWDIVHLKPIKGAPTGLAVGMAPSTALLEDRDDIKDRDDIEDRDDRAGALFETPWHVLQVADSPGKLLESNIMVNLNPDCRIEDSTWIEPGLAMWDWRAWGAKTEDGFTYGLDMPSWRRFIDFASEHDIRYLVLDAGWYGLEFDKRSDPRTSRDYLLVQPDPQNPRLVPRPAPAEWDDPIDIPALIRYGKSKNVGIILYFNHIARQNYPFEETLALYRRWGAAGIKYGFMKGRGQQKVRETRKIIALCAKHQLLCNFHDGPVPPSGDRRAYPNCIAREFCHSQSDARRAFSPAGFCEQVFVNMLAGPLDMCNGLYTLKNPARDRPKIFTNVNTTIVAETARVMITFSGVSILPDCPEAYEARSDLFDFLGKLPMTWDETRILHGEIGRYITTARRSGCEWFLASATNEEPRTLQLSLDFLEPDQVYVATLYEDAPDAHYIENREAYRVRQFEVTRSDTIGAPMAPGGGHCVYLEPKPRAKE